MFDLFQSSWMRINLINVRCVLTCPLLSNSVDVYDGKNCWSDTLKIINWQVEIFCERLNS